MLSLEDAETVITLIKSTLDPTTKVRLAIPYDAKAMQLLYERGYLPVLERNAWNEQEIVISTPKCFTSTSS